MDSIKKTARLAGLLYLLVVLSGPFVLLYVPGKVFVPGDATATIDAIVSHATLYRASIVVGIISELAFVMAVLTLYRLLKPVHEWMAMFMVVFIMIDVPLAFLSTANQVATLALTRGSDFLSVFEKPQRDALTALLINFDHQGIAVSEVLWGLWLLPLGLLVYRSRFLPRFLGVWLFINGLAYLALSATELFWPASAKMVRTITMPALFGELVLMLWLLIIGARVKTAHPNNPHVGGGTHAHANATR